MSTGPRSRRCPCVLPYLTISSDLLTLQPTLAIIPMPTDAATADATARTGPVRANRPRRAQQPAVISYAEGCRNPDANRFEFSSSGIWLTGWRSPAAPRTVTSNHASRSPRRRVQRLLGCALSSWPR